MTGRWTMNSRTFALALVGGCILLALATAIANVVIDPHYVFRVNIVQTKQYAAQNWRYQRLLDYRRDGRRIDALLFGSSRGFAFDTAEMERLAGLGHVANFSVPAGSMSDHLPELEFIVRDKAAHGERLRDVLLLLDADIFGTQPWTNRNLDSFLPPEISGESRSRFWLRYLAAVQFKRWAESLKAAGWLPRSAEARGPQVDKVRIAALDHQPLPTIVDGNTREAAGGRTAVLAELRASPRDDDDRAGKLARAARSTQPFLTPQLAELDRFIALCRNNGIRLTVAINPLNAQNASEFLPERLSQTVARINQLTDLWDFSAPDWLAQDPLYWTNPTHFKTPVASMMLQRMFSPSTSAPADFGRLRRKTGS
jgi:hypothetical protein